MVIAVLAVIWVVALTPMILRKLSEHRLANSVDSFHRQLRGLRRAYPRLAASAAHPEIALATGRTKPGSGFRMSSGVVSSAERDIDEIDEPARRSPSQVTRRTTAQAARRRQVILVLVAVMLFFLVLGIVPVLRVLWDASLLAFGATAAYLALLIHFQRHAMEREVKVADFEDRRIDPRSSVWAVGTAPAHVANVRVMVKKASWADEDLLEEDLLDDRRFDREIVAGGR